jgi:hypothetical protein
VPHGIGDKLRIKQGRFADQRGTILARNGTELVVRLESSGRRIRVAQGAVTNFSLAARRAWVTAPNRRVGRRKGSKIHDRVSVTLRIDRELWVRFQKSEALGRISDRTAVINQWFIQQLDALEHGEASLER